MKRSAFALLALVALLGSAKAQISLIGDSGTKLWRLNTLEDAGPKVAAIGHTQITIFNLDLSLYQQITAPPLPAPYVVHTRCDLITEDLFDNDPSTIEYYQHYEDTTGQSQGIFLLNNHGFRILRQDGTVLFDTYPGWLGNDPIFNTPQGTFMLVDSVPGGYTKVYLLPGHLPCAPCDGSGVVGIGDHHMPDEGSLSAFPNPANNSAFIRYELIPNAGHGDLVFFDLQGALVGRIRVDRSGQREVTTSDLPAGTYVYQLECDGHVIGAQRLVVVH